MSYARWSHSNWYVYWDVGGYVSVTHCQDWRACPAYQFNESIDDYINALPDWITEADRKELRGYLEEANADFNAEAAENGKN